MNHNSQNNTIKTERLLLRPFRETDIEAVVRHCNNVNVYKSTLALPYPYTAECAASWIASHKENVANNTSFEFAVTDSATGELYGCVGLVCNAKDNNAEAGYWIGEAHWGNGFATEALRAVIEFAFRHKHFHKVHARHFLSNPASGRVMQKAGMTHEGTLPDHVRKDGAYEAVVCYGIVADTI